MTTKRKPQPAKTGKARARLINYSPEVEAMRPTFEAVARNLNDALRLHYSKDALDVDPPGDTSDEPAGFIIWSAIQEHLSAVFELVETNDPRFLTTVYVELRLFIEQRRFELKDSPVGGVASPQVEALAKRLSDFMQDASSDEQRAMNERLRELETEIFPLGYEHAELMPKAKVVLGRALGRVTDGHKYNENNREAWKKFKAVEKLLSKFEGGE